LPVPAIATLAPQEGDLTEAEALPIARELLETLGIDARLLENATLLPCAQALARRRRALRW
jgi:hypothetical protein